MRAYAKKAVAVGAVVIILVVAYFGNYLPLRKSQKFISVLRNVGNIHTLQDFIDGFSSALDAPSPIGHEELVRNMSNFVLGVMRRNSNPELIAAIVEYVEQYFQPILERGKGMSFGQNLTVLGELYLSAYRQTQNPAYLEKARAYHLEGLLVNPKRPQFLYGLFEVYRLEGSRDGMREIGAKILANWPDDKETRAALEALGPE